MRHPRVCTDEPAYREVLPPPGITSYVEACWFFQPQFTEPTRDILIPEGVVDVIFNFGDAYFRQRASAGEEEGNWLAGDIVTGQRTELFVTVWPEDTRLLSIRLKPEAAYLFFDMPLHRMTNLTQAVEQTAFAGLSRLVRRHSFQNHAGIADQCFAYVMDIASGFGQPDERLSTVIREIRKREGNADIRMLCEELGFNRRTIERLFADRVGVSPKFLARTIRLHHFLFLQREHTNDKLTGTALDAQYYDQSHLIKDFRKFTGESPARFFDSPPDIYEPLLTSLLARRLSEGRLFGSIEN